MTTTTYTKDFKDCVAVKPVLRTITYKLVVRAVCEVKMTTDVPKEQRKDMLEHYKWKMAFDIKETPTEEIYKAIKEMVTSYHYA